MRHVLVIMDPYWDGKQPVMAARCSCGDVSRTTGPPDVMGRRAFVVAATKTLREWHQRHLDGMPVA